MFKVLGEKKKSFIDKKSATKYSLSSSTKPSVLNAVQADQFFSSSTNKIANEDNFVPKDKSDYERKIEQLKYGIYFDDDYDYLQHLASVNENISVFRIENTTQPAFVVDRPNQILPERVFKEDSVISTVSSSTLQADYDLDVLAQLEDDVVHNKEWEIEDDFIIKAKEMKLEDIDYNYKFKDGFVVNGDHVVDIGGSTCVDSDLDSTFEEKSSSEVETVSRFTEYSLSSSVLPRNSGLTFVDEQFEEFSKQYDDYYCEDQDLDGTADVNELIKNFKALNKKKKRINVDPQSEIKDNPILKRLIKWCNEELNSDDEKAYRYEEDLRAHQWLDYTGSKVYEDPSNIESFLNQRPVYANQPSVLEVNKRKNSLLLPIEKRRYKKISNSVISDQLEEVQQDKGLVRDKHETLEEKKERKTRIRQERKARRAQKKKNKQTFKYEELAQEKQTALNFMHVRMHMI
ncbi:protein LTV1 homolog [Zophobas morio]|uniref:protein LTV1 homolog n=1 Tax=Zophobas morio TaxID=2755281 RepID=UPI003083DF47